MSAGLQIAILAAGEARRFGGGKLDRRAGGRRIGGHALNGALALGARRIVLIVRDPMPAFAQEAEAAGLAVPILNARADEGIGTSVALAATSAEEAGCETLLLQLADMPLVRAATLRRLVDAAAPGRPAAVRHADGNPGIPACFTRDWFGALQGLGGDRGAGALLRGNEATLIETEPAELRDVDTEADFSAIEALLG